MAEERLKLAIEYESNPHVDYSHPFGIGVTEIRKGEKEMVPWCTFTERERVVNAYGGLCETLGMVGCEVLAFRTGGDGFCEVDKEIAIEGLEKYSSKK